MKIVFKPSDEMFEAYQEKLNLLVVLKNRHMHPEVQMDDLEANAAIKVLENELDEMSH